MCLSLDSLINENGKWGIMGNRPRYHTETRGTGTGTGIKREILVNHATIHVVDSTNN